MQRPKEQLPCGVLIDPSRGECCKTRCPNLVMRSCDTKDPKNPIEVCYKRLKRAIGKRRKDGLSVD